ncbi:MAG: ATP-binding protein [Deltaproteobacteria bacterium]|nr:ATP-binding protein [Deltaproteobacteria bacterium]
MILSIASGKGGTGKTTVATNLALALGGGVQLLDCDVEEPNAALFIGPEWTREETFYAMVPEVDEDACSRCGQCAELCQFKAISVFGDTILTFPELCHSCGGCVRVCPEKAVTEVGRPLGMIRTGNRNGLAFADAELNVGVAFAPPLIRKVRSETLLDRTVIIDAPPGTSCPVIAAIKGTDFVLLVTEPTPFGLSDLKLAAEVVRILDMPCGLVINRTGEKYEDVHAFAEEKEIPVLMEIPFDRRIAEAYSRGEPMVAGMPEWRERFLDLYERIVNIVEHRNPERNV